MNQTHIRKVAILVAVLIVLMMGLIGVLWYRGYFDKNLTNHPANDSPANSASVMEDSLNWYKTNEPDIFIYNQMPIQQPTFDLSAEIAQNGKITFTVKLKTISLQQVQEEVNAWLLSTGLTQEQIDSLVIEYDASIN